MTRMEAGCAAVFLVSVGLLWAGRLLSRTNIPTED